MKSLKTTFSENCKLKNSYFTTDVLSHIMDEGFKWSDTNNSYSKIRNLNNTGCYIKHENNGSFDINIFICEDGIEIDLDYGTGGNLRNTFYSFSDNGSFDNTYDKMINYVNKEKIKKIW